MSCNGVSRLGSPSWIVRLNLLHSFRSSSEEQWFCQLVCCNRQLVKYLPFLPRPLSTRPAVERRAVDAVLAVEEQLGHQAEEMPHSHPGYDIRSAQPTGETFFIEVKGRIEGAETFVVTQNELRFAGNVPDAYVLALVEVSADGADHDLVRYLLRPYGPDVRLPFDTTSTILSWHAYWQRAVAPLGALCQPN